MFYRAAYGNRSEIFRLALIFFGGVLCVRGGDFGLPGGCVRIVTGDGKIQRKSKNCRCEKFEKYFCETTETFAESVRIVVRKKVCLRDLSGIHTRSICAQRCFMRFSARKIKKNQGKKRRKNEKYFYKRLTVCRRMIYNCIEKTLAAFEKSRAGRI